MIDMGANHVDWPLVLALLMLTTPAVRVTQRAKAPHVYGAGGGMVVTLLMSSAGCGLEDVQGYQQQKVCLLHVARCT